MEKSQVISVLMLACMFLFSITALKTSAQVNKNEIPVTVNSSIDSLQLSWNLLGNTFVVYDLNNDHSIVYEGKDTQLRLNSLSSDTLYRYKLSTYDKEGVLLKEYFISTHTDRDDKGNVQDATNNDINLNIANVIMSKNNVVLQWGKIPGVKEYDIYKNNQLIDTVTDTMFIDTAEMKDPYIPYEISFKIPLSENEKQEIKVHFDSIGKKLNEEQLNMMSFKPYSMIKVVDTSIVVPEIAIMGIDKSFKWTYKTFIPDNYAPNPWPLSTISSIKYFVEITETSVVHLKPTEQRQ